MRTAPVALAYTEVLEMLTQSARLSAMTHWDPQAEVCCTLYCLWMHHILAGDDLSSAWEKALAEARDWAAKGSLSSDTPGPSPLPDTFWPRFHRIETLTYDDLQPSGYAGYSVECLEAAAWCCLHHESAEAAIVSAVNLAGEADTIGAVAGGIAGLYWGAQALPERWLLKLHQRRDIEALGRELQDSRRR